MEVQIVYRAVKGDLFILMFLSIFFGFIYDTNAQVSSDINAQKWTFTVKLIWTGPCKDLLKSDGFVWPELPAIPSEGYPTQTQCDNARMFFVLFRKGTPFYDDKGHFIGDCTFSCICTACTEKNTPPPSPPDNSSKDKSQDPPPPVPDDGVRDGNNEEKDNNLSNDAGQLLRDQIKSYENPEQGGVVDLSGKSVNSNITPLLLTTQDEQAKADQWYLEQVQYQGYTFTKGNDIHDNTDKAIETGRDWTVATISLFSAVPVVKSYTYEAIAAGDLVAVGATWINDCYVRTPSNCPPPEAVAFRTAVNLSVDLGGAALGNLIHKVAPINNEIGKEGVENILNFLEFSGNRIDTRNGDLLKNILFPGEKDVNDEHW